ncbi:stage II sporulation protein D [Pseudogracilibacillus sp. SE30717A]|uniref:stage II sporulation protein D n=1 Tax=Pseudogracilibacillus sp. SE30717A TaxID=3098293 RepID=UPI00300E275E
MEIKQSKYNHLKKRRNSKVIKELSNRKSPLTSSNKSAWKLVGTITFSILLCTIVLVPTLIVMIPKKEQPTQGEVTDVFEEEQIEVPQLHVTVKRTATGEVEEVPLEKYVASVVASEMPAEFEVEALKAQAIAARTYIVNHLLHQEDKEEVIISDTTEHQVYKNEEELKRDLGADFHWKMEKVADAVNATKNEIITYEQQPITPTFFSMSNGLTEDAENYWGSPLPYLKSVESRWEESHPNFTEQTIFTIEEVNSKLGTSLPAQTAIPIKITRTESNRVNKLTLNDKAFSGREVREKLGLRSNDFSIQQKDNHLIFTTKGYGHGVGMSQYGANGMAEEGKGYKEILSYYYQDVEITTITEAAPTLVAK